MSNKIRCDWVTTDQIYIDYHDKQWGIPVVDDHMLFEYLVLEAAQAGLSWLTVLKKRECYREVYDNFNPQIIAHYDSAKKVELLTNPGIIRNKLKIESSIINANAFIKVQREFGSFKEYIWGFVDQKPIHNSPQSIKDLPSKSVLSDKISHDLKKRGFKFVGSKVVYAFMQATGIINDHLVSCFRYREVLLMTEKR